MDDFDFVVSLLTPATDLVSRSAGSRLEATFTRPGNDVTYAYDPAISSKSLDELIGVDTINGTSGLGVGEVDTLKREDDSDRSW